MKTTLIASLLVSVAACSSSSSSQSMADAPRSTPDAPPAPMLTVKNYLAWCSISVNGGTASAAGEVTVPITAPATITLAATATTGFELGPTPWHDTAGDHGSGDPGTVTGTGSAATSTTSVAVQSASQCVWACCPFPDGTGCPATDQCP